MTSTTAVCPNCHSIEIEYDSSAGNSACVRCGAVVEENVVVAEVTFAELSNGASALEGQFIPAERGKTILPTIFGRRVGNIKREGEGDVNESREMTLANGRRRIMALAGAVGLNGEHYIDAAHRWYALALQHQFTRGRRGPNVIAACLYIVCRQEKTPHMLLDFSDILSTSVYSLGGTFLRLVRLLNLEIPIVDPSFFVARFAARLEFDDKTSQVSNTALRLVARMKRDWIQTGRRPAGVCAAGLIIAARMHGFRRTETEVVRVVRICEATLKKRLDEFGRTPTSQLTPQEFEGIWLEQEADPPSFTHTRPKPAEVDTFHILPSIYFNHPTKSLPLTPQSQNDNIAAEKEDASLSDVEIDDEIESMILNETEIDIKTRYWTRMNKDFLEREAEREKANTIANTNQEPVHNTIKRKMDKEGYEDEIRDHLDDNSKAPVKAAKSKKTRHTKNRTKESVLAGSAAEATKQILQGKKFSKKINYEALDELFSSTAAAVG